jgi:dipeptidyl aminopeptidase/acylaminoacyl peptidase
VDYVNDSIDLRVQSKAPDGAPDKIVQQIAEGLIVIVKRRRDMPEKTIAPYGSWKSPITTELMTAKSIGLGQLALDNGDIYLSESRPLEGGRNALVRFRPGSEPVDCIPSDFNARTRVHEYGGGAFDVFEGVIYFVNFKDQHLYRIVNDGAPELMTPGDGYRYADFAYDKKRNRLICVREDHTQPGEAVNTIVAVSLNGNDNDTVLLEGCNFYSNPRLSPDGTRLCWLAWNHPHMPWDGTELWVASIQPDGTLGERKQVPGRADDSIFQPEWSPAGVLHFISDRSGWWNLYRMNGAEVEALHPLEAEFGGPQWIFGLRTYAFINAQEILCMYTQNGQSRLARLNTATKSFAPLDLPYTEFFGMYIARGFAVFEAASATEPYALVKFELATGRIEVLRRSFEPTVDTGYFSLPQAVEFPTERGLTAHGIFYAPANKDYTAPAGALPPLMVISHGGPTGATGTSLRYGIQYWTSRGFAVLDVNYGGSTGYGTAYRRRLNGNWGVVDVEDCCNGARWLAAQGRVDPKRMAIRGGSAGGYTTLAALTFQPEVFSAGASHFGIGDLSVFVYDTHKFESRYCDTLIGPYPERKDLYHDRSPINFINKMAAPLILFQGAEDKIVPPNQAELMFEAVRGKELPVAYLLFEGEQHGFRKAENIKRSYEAELYFYSKIFKFDLVDEIEPVEIENL